MRRSEVTYSDLLDVDLKSFGSAARDWQEVHRKLKTRAYEAEHDMHAKSKKAVWEGANADAVRPFVGKIAKEVEDLHNEATSISNIIDGAYAELVAVQENVKEEKAKASRLDAQITDNGDGTVTCRFREGTEGTTSASGYYIDDSNRKRSAKEREARNEIETRVNQFIEKAREIDESSSRYLAKSHGNDKHNSGHAVYKSLSDARSREAADLGKEQLRLSAQGKELSTKKLELFRDLVRYNAKEAEFSTGFYRGLGPENALRLHGQLSIDASTDGGKTRFNLSRDIQNSMDKGLALATHPGGGASGDTKHLGSEWVSALRKAGTEPIYLHDPQSNERGRNGMPQQKVLGYQVLGNMLRHGEYEKDLLTSVGNDMVEAERKGEFGSSGWPSPQHPSRDGVLSLDPKTGDGYDPMTGLMQGLDHNPDAATDFFHDSTDNGKEGGEQDGDMSNLDYFLGNDDGVKPREWTSGDETSQTAGKDALGGALEAATTGRSAGDEGKPLPHTADQASLFHSVVERLGGEGSPSVRHGGDLEALQPHMGNMAADYMHDIQRGIVTSPEGIIPTSGENDSNMRGADGDALSRFLRDASQNPDGYAAIVHSSHAVSAEAIRDAMDIRPNDSTPSEAASMGAEPGAKVVAEAAAGRIDGILEAQDKEGAVERYNKSLDSKQEIVGSIVDLGLGRLPYGSEAAGEVSGRIQEAVFDHYRKDPEEVAAEVERDRENFLAEEGKREADAMEAITKAVGERANIGGDSLEWAAASVSREVESGFPRQ